MFYYLVAFIVCLISNIIYSSLKRPKNYPPGPQWLPIVGNTPQVRKEARQLGGQHYLFEKWMNDYKSPVLGLKLGSEYVVVALTYPIVRAIHTNEDFDGRPDNFFLRLRTMGTRLGITCTDGPLWAEHRNFATRHLRQAGYGRQPMEVQIQTELQEILEVLAELNEAPIWPGKLLPPSVINVLWMFTAGKRIPRDDDRLQRLLTLMQQRSKAFDMSGGVLSQMPWLRFIAPEKSGFNLINRFNYELHGFFMEVINKHKLSYTDEQSNDDLIYAYIKEMKEQEGKDSTFTDIQLTMTILDIFIAGAQTTSITLDLALMMMVVRPDVQIKIQNEIDQTIESGSSFSLDQKLKLPYTEAVLMEIQRFFHIVPISGPRRTLKDSTLGGYDIPKNTTVLIGLRTVHMDEEYWGDPQEFRPERFLNENMEIINTERLIPFGQGKRRCLGDSLARACLITFFVGILKTFTVQLPETEEKPSIKLLPGITLSPKPYNVKFLKR